MTQVRCSNFSQPPAAFNGTLASVLESRASSMSVVKDKVCDPLNSTCLVQTCGETSDQISCAYPECNHTSCHKSVAHPGPVIHHRANIERALSFRAHSLKTE